MAGPELHPHQIPNQALDAFDLGSREFVHGNNERALELFTQAVQLHDDYSDALYLQGLTYLRLGRPDEAVAALGRAAETTGNKMIRDYAERKIRAVVPGGDAAPKPGP